MYYRRGKNGNVPNSDARTGVSYACVVDTLQQVPTEFSLSVIADGTEDARREAEEFTAITAASLEYDDDLQASMERHAAMGQQEAERLNARQKVQKGRGRFAF